MARRRITVRFGDVFEIPLTDGYVAYGHILRENLVGFYAVRSERRLSLQEIVVSNVAFRVECTIGAIQSGEWPIVGNAPPPAAMNEPIRFWRSPAPGFIFMFEWRATDSDEERRVAEVDIIGLEKSVIWNSPAVIERLEHFFRGQPDPRVVIG